MKRYLLIMITALVPLASGCQTVKGLGEDIESAGQAIQKKAKEYDSQSSSRGSGE